MRGWVIGLGRAGKRHLDHLRKLGYEAITFDPFSPEADQHRLSALSWKSADFAVIATPPSSHLYYAEHCLRLGLKVLVEKPLCGPGQLKLVRPERLRGLCIAFNYRYHPKLAELPWREASSIHLFSRQPLRKVDWGVLLDQSPHVFDILRFYSGLEVHLESAEVDSLGYSLRGDLAGIPFSVDDRLWEGDRRVLVELDGLPWKVDAREEMFLAMWEDFLGPQHRVASLDDGLIVQSLIARAAILHLNRTIPPPQQARIPGFN